MQEYFDTPNFDDEQDPRILFVQSSPVPRFRNVAPKPPSPNYMDIIIESDHQDDMSIIETIDNVHTVYTENKSGRNKREVLGEFERRMRLLTESVQEPKKHVVCFKAPYYSGQSVWFSLSNPLPEDYVILYKFMTVDQDQNDRYLIQPSAGKLSSIEPQEIRLFLNKAPMQRKDTIIIRWAVVQTESEIQRWLDTHLLESTRRRWIDLLQESWSNQISLKMTRIKVDFT